MPRTRICPQCGSKRFPEQAQGLCPCCVQRILTQLDAAEPDSEWRTDGKAPPLAALARKKAIMKTSQVILAIMLMAALARPAQTAQVNRTLPKVEPPKATLEFSANPTTQEIFHARVFEEPLVPIGGEPGADQNAALAAALLGYAR